MEELYIQIRDGQPHEHPIFADNFRQAFPGIDVNNPPLDRFAKFIRVEPPTPGTYEVYEGATYQWVEGVVTDVHIVRPMTDEERAAKDAKLAELALMQAPWFFFFFRSTCSVAGICSHQALISCMSACS